MFAQFFWALKFILEFQRDMVFGFVSGNYLYFILSECYKNTVIYLNYSSTRFLCTLRVRSAGPVPEQRLVIEPSLIPALDPLWKLSCDIEMKLWPSELGVKSKTKMAEDWTTQFALLNGLLLGAIAKGNINIALRDVKPNCWKQECGKTFSKKDWIDQVRIILAV